MGAAAAKQLRPDKTKHATVIVDAVRSFEENGPEKLEEYNYNTFNLPLFKRHVLLAAASSKKKGKDIDNSLAQLNDHDLEMLWNYIGKSRQEENTKKKNEVMTVEEFVDEENAGSNDNIDETTSVLSYG
jgi:hypothetical protein